MVHEFYIRCDTIIESAWSVGRVFNRSIICMTIKLSVTWELEAFLMWFLISICVRWKKNCPLFISAINGNECNIYLFQNQSWVFYKSPPVVKQVPQILEKRKCTTDLNNPKQSRENGDEHCQNCLHKYNFGKVKLATDSHRLLLDLFSLRARRLWQKDFLIY